MFEDIAKKIKTARIIPVVKLQDVQDALKLAEAFSRAGISAMEITFRTTQGAQGFARIAECIKAVSKEFPEMLLGAGTVINPELAKTALNSGANFAVSPGFNRATVKWCVKHKMPFFPGVSNSSEIEEALMYGLNVLKFFPAEVCGGAKMFKALSGPFPQVSFIATGGISQANIKSYFDCKNVCAVGGSWMAEEKLISAHEWEQITEISRQALKEAGV